MAWGLSQFVGVGLVSWVNFDDVRRQLEAAGLDLSDGMQLGRSARPGGLWRVPVRGGGKERRGWYLLHEIALDNGDRLIVGSFGIWRGDDSGAQKVELRRDARTRVDATQLEAIKARQREDRARADAERQAQIERAARRAAAWWSQAADEGLPAYVTRKGLASRHGARVSPAGNLIVPMHDAQRNVRGLQVVYCDPRVKERKGRDKDYAPPGVSTKGLHFTIGAIASGGVVLVAEGYATGASLHEATGLPVLVAFDAGNMLPAVEQLRKVYKRRLRLLFCGDDDYLHTCQACKQWTTVLTEACDRCGQPHKKRNTGRLAAEAAALAVDGAAVFPSFPALRPLTHKGPTDFNDLHVHPQGGLSMVAAQIEARLSALGWSVQGRATGGAPDKGGGERRPLKGLISVDEAVRRYSLIYGGSGTLFDHQEHQLVPKSDVLDILPDHGWREWKNHPQRSVVRLDEVGFDPTEADARIKCNLWGGWPTRPAPGRCEVLLDLLRSLCSAEDGGPQLYDWVLRWLAYPLQHPGAKMKTALVFHGPQGTGKSLFFETILGIYGAYGRLVDQAAIEDKFTDWMSRKLFLVADEVVARAELYHVKNKLKHYVTGEWIRINPKNVAAHDERNHVNIVFLSNEKQPLVLEEDDRRYTVVWTPPALSAEFYKEAAAELANGGAAALHQHLLDLDLGDFSPHAKPPRTQAKAALIGMNRDSVSQFLIEWEEGETAFPFGPALSQDLYTAYSRWCSKNGEHRPRSHNQFSGHVAKLTGWSCGPRHVFKDCVGGTTAPRRLVVPPVEKLAAAGLAQPAGATTARWLSDAVSSFAESLNRL